MTTYANNNSTRTNNTFYLWLVILVLSVTGCASTKYHDAYRPDTDFSQLKTYQWRNVSSEIGGVTSPRLQQITDAQLSAQGFVLTESAPDMLFDLTLVARTSTGSSTGIGLSIGLPIGGGGIGLGGGKSVPNEKMEGVLILDVTKAMNNLAIWRGTAEGIPMNNFSLKEEDKLAAVVGKLTQQFASKK